MIQVHGFTCKESVQLLENNHFYNLPTALALFSAALIGAMLSANVSAASDVLLQCASKTDNVERLSCYDALNTNWLKLGSAANRSFLTRSWDLDNRDDELFGEGQSPLRPHLVSYLIVRKSDAVNHYPNSPSHPAAAVSADIEPTEVKFQISEKAKILNHVDLNFWGLKGFRLWGAYTQQSSWQAFNAGNSSPFRETNYEPELIASFSTGNDRGLKLINVGLVHQSNGLNLSASRSWNRVYLQGGWESETVSALLKGWWRVPESANNDDNPDIVNYVGRGELSVRWEPLDHTQVVNLILRNNLSADPNRSFVQIDWATPVTVSYSTKLHIQFTSGYGESLIDYNFYQTSLGVGVSFRDW